MAKKEEEQKKPGGGDDDQKDMLLEEAPRDPDEAVLAEQAILHYAHDVLERFVDELQAAVSQVESFLSSQQDPTVFNDGRFLEQLGAQFMHQLSQVCGGHHTPIARVAQEQLASVIASAAGGSADAFCQELSSAASDLVWYLRDNLQSVLSNEWDKLRDLAYEGSTDFIAALHAYGLPSVDFTADVMSRPLIDDAEKYLEALPKKKEKDLDPAQAQQIEDEEKKQEEEQAQQMAVEEEEEKEVA